MSPSESKWARFTINMVNYAPRDSALQGLYELADCVFSPAGSGGRRTMLQQSADVYYLAAQTGDPELSPVVIILQKMWNQGLERVVVDLQTRTVRNSPESTLSIESEQIERATDAVKAHIRNEWKRNGVEKPTNWRDFLQRLALSGIPPIKLYSDPSSSIHRRCPLCETKTSLCISCRHVMCLHRACVVSQTLPFHSCSQHPSNAMCLPCAEDPMVDGWQRLSQCPQCTLWFCDTELIRCLGRPIHLPDRPSDNGLDGISNTREHPTKLIGCSSCMEGSDRRYCTNGECWSSSPMQSKTIICESCSPEGGLWCVCRRVWVCDACRAFPVTNASAECPRCRRVYCHWECNYVGICAECHRPTLCHDCFEEDCGGLVMDVDAVKLRGKCHSDVECWGAVSKMLCEECLERLTRCAGCRTETVTAMCSSCLRHPIMWEEYGRWCTSCIIKVEEEIEEESE